MTNPLAGKPLRYLIGADDPGHGADDVITEVPYDHGIVLRGISVGYCNLFDENNTGAYGPYLSDSDTAGSGRPWAMGVAQHAMGLRNLGVTFSRHGEYGSSEDLMRPQS